MSEQQLFAIVEPAHIWRSRSALRLLWLWWLARGSKKMLACLEIAAAIE